MRMHVWGVFEGLPGMLRSGKVLLFSLLLARTMGMGGTVL
jgi:hypothetical protein